MLSKVKRSCHKRAWYLINHGYILHSMCASMVTDTPYYPTVCNSSFFAINLFSLLHILCTFLLENVEEDIFSFVCQG
ncbi:hypothetical protein J3E68DRAFT_217359 [Trichoderma sp. SZMC 28012]